MACKQTHRIAFLLCAVVAGVVGGCAGSGGGDVVAGRGEGAATVPDDFWVSATVLGPVRTGSATQLLARGLRPGRYVVEPDRGLRVSLGTGAMETTFPPLTRTLTRGEFTELWSLVNSAGLLDARHPNAAKGNGAIDPETIEGKTVYVLTAHARGRHELVILEVEPECGEWCARAKGVVEWMGGKAWMKDEGK